MDAFAAHRPSVPLPADLFVLRCGLDPHAWRMGRKLDGGGASMPLRAVGRAWLDPAPREIKKNSWWRPWRYGDWKGGYRASPEGIELDKSKS